MRCFCGNWKEGSRGTSPGEHVSTRAFGRSHRRFCQTTRSECLGVPPRDLGTPHASAAVHLVGGLGLVSAVRVLAAAHWASWADSLQMVRQRNLRTARLMIRQLEADDPVSCFVAVNQCQRVMDGHHGPEEEQEPSQQRMGCNKELPGSWRRSSSTIQCGQLSMTALEPSSVHSGPLASAPLTALPTSTCLFLYPCAPADVAASLICLAIILQRVPWQGFWGRGGSS